VCYPIIVLNKGCRQQPRCIIEVDSTQERDSSYSSFPRSVFRKVASVKAKLTSVLLENAVSLHRGDVLLPKTLKARVPFS